MARILVLSRRGITNPSSGGASRYVHEIFRRLASRHRITVLSGNSKKGSSVEEIDGISYMSCSGPIQRALIPLRYFTELTGPTDLLVDNADVGIPWLTPLFSRLPRITIIHQMVREIFYDELPRPFSDLGFAVEPWIYRLYSDSTIVAPSKSTARDLIGFGIRSRNIHVIEPGCSIPNFERPDLSVRSPEIIACVSRLMKYKGVQLGFKVVQKLAEQIPEIRLIIAGSGPYEKELVRTAKQLGITENVEFVGKVTDESRNELYGRVRVAISPSRREGFGISVIEANSMGTPVVGWEVPGLRDSIIDGTTGFLVPFGDYSAFAERITTLLKNDKTWFSQSNSALKWAKDHSWDRSAKEFETVIDAALTNQ